jgi:hypothetical protein
MELIKMSWYRIRWLPGPTRGEIPEGFYFHGQLSYGAGFDNITVT